MVLFCFVLFLKGYKREFEGGLPPFFFSVKYKAKYRVGGRDGRLGVLKNGEGMNSIPGKCKDQA